MRSSTAQPSSSKDTSKALSNESLDPASSTIVDDFSSDRQSGRVIGSQAISGHQRRGIDVEKLMSIDNGALRIQPPITPGWARAGIAYGPFQRRAGLALAIFMLNGHNTSEGNSREDSFKSRIWRWVRGTQANSIGNRLWRRASSSQHQGTTRQFYRWARNHRRRFKKDGQDTHLMENLALGWFSSAVPADPTKQGHSIVVRALGPDNGELCTRCDSGRLSTEDTSLTPAFQGLQNVQTYYLVLLREQGAAYYAASVANAKGLAAFPNMRLIGIDAPNPQSAEPAELYAGLYQGALGQVGFRVDTRVYDFQTAQVPALSNWYGTAQTADTLIADEVSLLTEQAAELGGRWHPLRGTLEKTAQGLAARTENSLALLEMPTPAGAIHAIVNVVNTDDSLAACALLWRTQDERNTWGLFFEQGQCQIRLQTEGKWSKVAVEESYGLREGRNAVQILDSGSLFSLYLNGQLLFDRWFTDDRLGAIAQIGLLYKNGSPDNSGPTFTHLEAHPREIPIPAEFKLGPPWHTAGTKTHIADSFSGPPGELSGRPAEVGNGQWQKTLGTGQMQLTGEGALKVKASVAQPNPGRLAYTLPWSNPSFADVAVDILPPGTARHQNEKGRGGLIFWQDADNYITINQWLDDGYGGAAISAFFHIDGFEEVYDAIWTNVGTRVQWGQQQMFRIAFDGLNFTVYLGEEPVLYRALTDIYAKIKPLSIQRVGLVANWEWGDDTGTQFNSFVAKA